MLFLGHGFVETAMLVFLVHHIENMQQVKEKAKEEISRNILMILALILIKKIG